MDNEVAFMVDLDPIFDTGRTLLRIDPYGNSDGTAGCVGLTECLANTITTYYN